MDLNEFDWPDVTFIRADVESCAQWSGLREVHPVFSRAPYGDWCHLFRECCQEDDGLNWMGAGFARCNPDDVDSVTERLRAASAAANERFRVFLAKVLENQPRQARDLIALEGANAVSENGEGYPCRF